MTTVFDERLRCWQCGQVHRNAQLITLHDGRQVGNYSEEWMLEGEANAVVRLPTVDRRRAYLRAVEEKRGKPAMLKLQDRIWSLWKSRSSNAQPQVARNSSSAAADTPTDGRHGQPGKTGDLFF